MPGVALLRAKETGNATRTIDAEHLSLHLPSALVDVTNIILSPVLRDIELRLRHAQANDALEQMRRHLRARSRLYNVKDRDVRGQRYNTRARTYINTLQDKIDSDAARYRLAHQALLALDPRDTEKWQKALRPLEATDVRAMKERLDNETEGTRTLPWIWRTAGFSGSGAVEDEEEDELEGMLSPLSLPLSFTYAVSSRTDRVVPSACSSTPVERGMHTFGGGDEACHRLLQLASWLVARKGRRYRLG